MTYVFGHQKGSKNDQKLVKPILEMSDTGQGELSRFDGLSGDFMGFLSISFHIC